jgi:hypothetical protein
VAHLDSTVVAAYCAANSIESSALTEETAPARKKKPNSPKAPGTSLRTAVTEVSKVYQRYSHGSFSRSEMASALNMSANSGAFLGKAATLKEYGLISEGGGSAQVSDLFKSMYAAAAGSIQLKRHAWQAVRTPAVFARLLQQFSARIPDETALAIRLESQEKFNRERALAVAAAFRTSLTDYGLIDANGNVLSVRDEPSTESPRDERGADDEDIDEPEAGRGPGKQRLEVALRDGRKAVLILPDDLTTADTRKISALLNALAADYDAD